MGFETGDIMGVRHMFSVMALVAALAPAPDAQAANADWPNSLTLATASPGGVYIIYGEALAKILTDKLGIAVNPLPTQGPVHNVKLLDSGGAQLGFTTMGVAAQGWNGTGDWTDGKRFRNMRALFPMYDTPFQAIVLQRSGIATIEQLNGKRVGVGPRAGTGSTYIPAVLKALGISADVTNGSFDHMADELFSGDYDAVMTLTGAPVPAIVAGAEQKPFILVRPSPEQINAVRKAIPEFSPSKIPAGTYSFLDKDYDTFGVFNFAIGRSDLPDDLVYQLVKAAFENQPTLLKAHSTARETIPQNVVKDSFLPLHPGALRYYREIGVKIPDALVPTN
jgi:TRAP transporter TAXI family solute receptor